MAIAETLVITLGPSIAKAVFKLWLQDDIPVAISSSLVDLVAKKTSDTLEQRQLKRTFEDLGDRIASNLVPIFHQEHASLTEGDQIAVIEQVAIALDNTEINVRTLAEQQFEPGGLTKQLDQANPDALSGFSADQTALYQRLLSEISQDVVDIVPKMPGFAEQSLVLLLKQNNLFLDRLNSILDGIRVNREGSSSQFESDYLRAVLRNLDELVLFGADVSPANKSQKLSVAYITLAAQVDLSKGDTNQSIALHDKSEHATVLHRLTIENEKHIDTITFPVDIILAHSKRLLIRGEAGSGKTTLLKWIAVRAAQHNFEGELAQWNHKIPFFIRLREVLDDEFPTPKQFPSLISKIVGENTPDSWVHELLQSGRAIVLIDGVDEIPKDERERMWNWLNELIETYLGHSIFIVTSRPYAIDNDPLISSGFTLAELQPMNQSDIHQFIDHWHRAVISENVQDEEVIANLNALAENLKRVLQEKRSLRELATSPLLCAMICALHRESKRQLPDDRIELYRRTCRMLIERDVQKEVNLTDYPKLSYRQQYRLLANLAYAITVSSRSEIPYEQARDNLDNQLELIRNDDVIPTGEMVLRYLLERTGIVRQPSVDRISFTHRTFQEFLTADASVHNYYIGALITNAHDDQWREVIILAAGLAHQLELGELINGLLERGDTSDDDNAYSQYLLAASCLDIADQRDAHLVEAVSQRVETIIPPKSEEQAVALATAGDLAVPFLVRYRNASPDVAMLCVTSLMNIATEDSMKTLKIFVAQGPDTPEPIRNVVLENLASIHDKVIVADLIDRLGTTLPEVDSWLCDRGMYLESIDLCGQQLELIKETGDNRAIAEIQFLIARNLLIFSPRHWKYDDFGDSLVLAQESLDRFQEIGDQRRIAEVRYLIAQVMFRNGQYDAALSEARESLDNFQEIGNQRRIAEVRYLIAQIMFRNDQYDAALSVARESLDNFQEIGDQHRIGHVQYLMVQIMFRNDQYDAALSVARESLDNFQGRGIFWKSDVQYLMAQIMFRNGQYDEALATARESLTGFQEFDVHYPVANIQHLIAQILYSDEQYEEALTIVRKSLDDIQNFGDLRLQAKLQQLMAQILYSDQQYEEALAIAQKSLDSYKKLDDANIPPEIKTLIDQIMFHSGRDDDAIG